MLNFCFGGSWLVGKDWVSNLRLSLIAIRQLSFYSQRNPFIACNADFAAWEASKRFAIAKSAACASRYPCLRLTSASRTSTRITALCAAKICFPRASLLKTCPVVTRFTRTASENSRVLTIAVRSAKRLSSVNRAWRRLGKRGLGISRSTQCRRICSALSISCAMTVKPRAPVVSGISSVSSVHDAAL
jgi:hypothetical protein